MPLTITENHETAAHKKSGHKSRNIRTLEARQAPTEFICVDGEGVTLDDGTHQYVMLGIGQDQIINPDGLHHDEIFRFLWAHRKPGKVAYTGFFLGYDFIQWLRSISEHEATMLLTIQGKAARQRHKSPIPFPVYINGDQNTADWEIDILGWKRFKFRPMGETEWMNICDTGPFFQKSFLAAIDPAAWTHPIVTPEEYAKLAEGKSKRATAELDADMASYNRLENDVLARMLTELESGFHQLGVYLRPDQWYGPGQAASAWLAGRAPETKNLQEIIPAGYLEAARKSYFGGWFEIMAHGHIPGTSYEYDINSAYPYIISRLPCLEHGTYSHGQGSFLNYPDSEGPAIPDTGYTLVYAHILGRDKYTGSMLHRLPNGFICRPGQTRGWYWLHELEAADEAGLIGMCDIHEWWHYQPCDCPPPLAEAAEVYKTRKRVGKNTPLGIACKLMLNSLYGKFAQSIGHPRFGNPIYASLITAGCRTMITQAIASHPTGTKDLLMVATDGVYFRTPHTGLKDSKALGGWECGTKENLTLFKPGVYWDDKARKAIANGETPVFKARGVNARDFGKQIAELDQLFSRRFTKDWEWPQVEFPISFSMISALQALQRNNWRLAGTLIQNPSVTQTSNPRLKRMGPFKRIDGIIRGNPLKLPSELIESVPYEKRFGLEDPFSDETYHNFGMTPDGLPGMMFREALNVLSLPARTIRHNTGLYAAGKTRLGYVDGGYRA